MKGRAQGEWGRCSGLQSLRPQHQGSSLLRPSTGISFSCQWRRWLCTQPQDGPREHAGWRPWSSPPCAHACAQCLHLCKGGSMAPEAQSKRGSTVACWLGLLAPAPQGAAPLQCSSSKAPLFPSCFISPPAELWPCPPALGSWSRNRRGGGAGGLGPPSTVWPWAGADSLPQDISPGSTC